MMTKVDLLKPNVDPKHINPNVDGMKPKLGDGLVLAAGGCGHAAKGADEIGETFFLMRLMSTYEMRLVINNEMRLMRFLIDEIGVNHKI